MFEITTTVDRQRIADLLVGAIEGGSNYWIDRVEPRYATHEDYSEAEAYGPTMKARNFYADGDPFVLDYAAIQRGLKLLPSVAGGRHFANFMAENDDAETSDVFLQLCLFGEIVYG